VERTPARISPSSQAVSSHYSHESTGPKHVSACCWTHERRRGHCLIKAYVLDIDERTSPGQLRTCIGSHHHKLCAQIFFLEGDELSGFSYCSLGVPVGPSGGLSAASLPDRCLVRPRAVLMACGVTVAVGVQALAPWSTHVTLPRRVTWRRWGRLLDQDPGLLETIRREWTPLMVACWWEG
jgi:hypothetical protein